MNVTVCSGTNADIPCGFTGVDAFNTRPDWRIVRRNNDGDVISNDTVNGVIIQFDRSDGLVFMREVLLDNSANGSYLSVGPVDDTYNNTSYQCIFTINDTIIESDTAGTVIVIGMFVATYISREWAHYAFIYVPMMLNIWSCVTFVLRNKLLCYKIILFCYNIFKYS